MSGIMMIPQTPTSLQTPLAGKVTIFLDSTNGNAPSYMKDDRTVFSLQGSAGSQGATGLQGPPGLDGEQGDPGNDGTIGSIGRDGQPGANGTSGQDSFAGIKATR